MKNLTNEGICQEFNFFLIVGTNVSTKIPCETSGLSKLSSIFLKSTDYLETEEIINSLDIKNFQDSVELVQKVLSQLRQNRCFAYYSEMLSGMDPRRPSTRI